MSKGTYYRRKEQGLCVRCGEKVEEERKGKSICFKCKEKDAKRAQATREFRRNMGFCPRCGVNKLFGDERNCPECRAKNEIYFTKQREDKEKYYSYESNRRKCKRDKNRENGLCTLCGCKKESDGHVICYYCRKKHNEYMKKYNLGKKSTYLNMHEYWRENGLCSNCGKECKDGYKVCTDCYEKILIAARSENSAKAREKIKAVEERRYIEYISKK